MIQRIILLTFFLFASAYANSGSRAEESEQKCGVWTMKIGEIDFYCLEDHTREIENKHFEDAAPEELREVAPEGKSLGSNTLFVIKKGDQVLLVDSGSHGKLTGHLKMIGLTPEDITAVLITHAHIFPLAGLIRGDVPVFPKASLWFSGKEAEYLKKKWRGKDGFYAKCDRAYGGIKLIVPDEKTPVVLKEVTAIDLPGHTPGHTGFMVSSQGKQVAVVGDLVLSGTVQMAKPDLNIWKDEDKEQAKETRWKMLTRAATEKLVIAASRLPFPGVGRIENDGDGFRLVPLSPDEGKAVTEAQPESRTEGEF